ncbi:UNVERIFIED_CONTAM: Aspartic proteinase-like protein 2 [Sesamum radiatum]|uniref:Aspartic proteinase-like protein 2 n=1 Tax=Sesamum radiatum TaxID=300843 RepID=A0AAW2ULI6_SESRA
MCFGSAARTAKVAPHTVDSKYIHSSSFLFAYCFWKPTNDKEILRLSRILEIELQLFDPSNSSTASVISCSDRPCALGARSSDAACADHSRCGYKFRYADGSGTSGYYVSDSVYLDTILGNQSMLNASAPIIFGCSTSHSGDLISTDNAVDGILGLGQPGISLISQLSAQGITQGVFAHCLRGENGGGGVLVLGQTEAPNMVYTPLVPSQSLYHVNLQSIAINGQNLNIDPSVFATSKQRGTILDSGTTLAFLAEEAFDPFVKTITQAVVSKSAHAVFSKENHCYRTNSSEMFPLVHLNFAGDASMILKPQDYLLQQHASDGSMLWCIGFQNNGKMTILGDLVLKDRMVVYDLAGQRIGWADYNCIDGPIRDFVDVCIARSPNPTDQRPVAASIRSYSAVAICKKQFCWDTTAF